MDFFIEEVRPRLFRPEPMKPITVGRIQEPTWASDPGTTKVKVGDYVETETGVARVLERKGLKHGNKTILWRVQFQETGSTKIVPGESITRRSFKDQYARTVYGIGYVGEYLRTPLAVKLWRTWRDMMARCYESESCSYHTHGAKGVHVCTRWHNFSDFLHDATLLPGFDRKLRDWSGYCLDKDVLHASNRYGPDTCIWAGKDDQQHNRDEVKFFRAVSANGLHMAFPSASYAAKQIGVSRAEVTKRLSGKSSEGLNGWYGFEYMKPSAGKVLRYRSKELVEAGYVKI